MTAASPLAAYEWADAIRRDAARQVAWLIAATLTTQIPDAAYLVIGEDSDDDGGLWLESVLDDKGTTLHEIGRENPRLLPALPEDSPLLALWEGRNPRDPWVLLDPISRLWEDGMILDRLPEYLPGREDTSDTLCLLLSAEAHAQDHFDGWGNAKRLLRPSGIEGIPWITVESPVSGLLSAVGPDVLIGATRAGIELYERSGDRYSVLTDRQLGYLTAAADYYRRTADAPDQ